MKIFIDIETIPGLERPEPHEVKVDARLKDLEKIAIAQREGVEDAYRKQSLDSMSGRIWCICVACDDGPVRTFIGDEESELLLSLSDFLRECGPVGRDVEWVGHNAVSFDMRWIWRRAIKYGLSYLLLYINMDRFRGNVRDTMMLWACGDVRDYVKLDTLAQFLGVGTKTPGMDGSKVYDLWVGGKADECASYCSADVELTRSVYRKLTNY